MSSPWVSMRCATILPSAESSALELQARLARGIGQRTQTAVIEKPVAIEHHLGDSLAQASLGDRPADRLGRLQVAPALERLAQLGAERGHRGQRGPGLVRDHLRVDMVERTVNRQAWKRVAAPYPAAHAPPAHHPLFKPLRRHLASFGALARRRAGRRLAGLAADGFGCVLDSFALVRLRRPQLSDLCRHRTEQLAIGTLQGDDHLSVDLGCNTGRQLINDRVRVAKAKMDIGAAYLGSVADAVYLQHAGEALAHALGHVGDELAHQPMACALVLGVARPLDLDLRILDLHREARRHLQGQLALGPLDLERVACQLGLDALVQVDRQSAYARHRPFLYQTLSRISPPTFLRRASRSVITPSGVVSTCTPIPCATRGIEVAPA